MINRFKIVNQETSRRTYPGRRLFNTNDSATVTLSRNALCLLAAARDFGAKLPGLSSLTAVSCPDLLDEDMLQYLAPQGDSLQGCGHALHELVLATSGSITPATLRHITNHAPNLRHLELRDLDIDEEPYTGQDDDDLPDAAPRLPLGHSSLTWLLSSLNLRSLTLSNLHTSHCQESFHGLRAPPSLTSLTLINMPDFTTKNLLAFPHVQHLTITSCPNIKYIPVSKPGELQELRVLSFMGSSMACVRLITYIQNVLLH